jgi:hypothetical protein
MRTSGGSRENLMLLVPVGVALAVGTMFYGGPTGLLDALDALVRNVAHIVSTRVAAWF